MIIATALGVVFEGMTIPYNATEQSVNYHYGDQKELLAWINLKTKAKQRKYPLIWYVLNEFTEFQGWYETDATIVILQNTKSEWFNPMRQSESYTKIIDPVWQNVYTALTSNGNIMIVGTQQDRFRLFDEPNYGVDSDKKEAKTTDIVDGRFVKFRLRINAQCII